MWLSQQHSPKPLALAALHRRGQICSGGRSLPEAQGPSLSGPGSFQHLLARVHFHAGQALTHMKVLSGKVREPAWPFQSNMEHSFLPATCFLIKDPIGKFPP